MNKQYYFLSGIHRSGNTVLSSIINQNPQIYVSQLSPVVEYLWRVHDVRYNFEAAIANIKDMPRSKNIISSLLDSYYEDVSQSIVIDRNKCWSNPGNLAMIKEYFYEKPKIVHTIRPLVECVASMINIMPNKIRSDMQYDGFIRDKKISEHDNMAEYLMNGNILENTNYSFISVVDNSNQGLIHLVSYSDLVNSPENTLKKIYEFLEIENYEHNFYKIQNGEKYKEHKIGLPNDMHKIKSQISKSQVNINNIFSSEMIEKINSLDPYIGANFLYAPPTS